VTIASAFRYFDIRSAGELTKNDFIHGLESLKIKLSSSDINSVFEYLDTSKDGHLTYSEFCNLCEEKRRNIDPFEVQDNKSIENSTLKITLQNHQKELDTLT
jgi:Ca2+-binding EF-hand superfamily protein